MHKMVVKRINTCTGIFAYKARVNYVTTHPNNPRVDRAEHHRVVVERHARRIDIVEHPAEFDRAEICCEGQAAFRCQVELIAL